MVAFCGDDAQQKKVGNDAHDRVDTIESRNTGTLVSFHNWTHSQPDQLTFLFLQKIE